MAAIFLELGECGAEHEEFAGAEGYLCPRARGHPVVACLTQPQDIKRFADLRVRAR